MIMKTIAGVLTGCLLVSIMIVFFTGCQKDDERKPVTPLAILPEFNGEADIYYGNINIRTTQSNEVVIAADIQNEVQNIDNISEINFVLQRKPGEGKPLNFILDNVRIRKNARSISIVKSDRSYSLFFTLDQASDPGTFSDFFTGYGLSQNTGRWAFDLAFLDGSLSVFDALCSSDYQLKEMGGGGGQNNDCHSGGPNSTSCTASEGMGGLGITETCSCSVSCGSESFSCCCDCERCFCVLNGTPGPYCNKPHGIN
jgi:hypothetical protein